MPDEWSDMGVPVVGYEGCGNEGFWVQGDGYSLEDFWDLHIFWLVVVCCLVSEGGRRVFGLLKKTKEEAREESGVYVRMGGLKMSVEKDI